MASPRSAAAVILVRPSPGPRSLNGPGLSPMGEAIEVFWVRRAAQMIFQGVFYAFPGGQLDLEEDARVCAARELFEEDRKSTRLNSSHEWISYAVFCLKKKKASTQEHL